MLSNLAGEISDALAEQGCRRIISCMPDIEAGTLSLRQRESLLVASAMGGMVISATGTTAVHAMGYSLTYHRGIEHGRANGLLLPAFLRFCEGKDRRLVEKVLSACGFSQIGELEELFNRLLGEREQLLPQEMEEFAAKAILTGNIAKCAVRPTKDDLETIYRESLS